MITMGVDQSLTSTGVVVTATSVLSPVKTIVHFEQIPTKKTYNDVYEDMQARIGMITDRVVHLAKKLNVDEVYIEAPTTHAKGHAAITLPALYGALFYALDEIAGVRPTTVVSSALKKFATGKGNADKEAMLFKIGMWDTDFWHRLEHMPKSKGKYDLADAYWLSRYGESNAT